MGQFKNLEIERQDAQVNLDSYDEPLDEEEQQKVKEADSLLDPEDYLTEEELEELNK